MVSSSSLFLIFQLHGFSDDGWATAYSSFFNMVLVILLGRIAGVFLGSNLLSWSSKKQASVSWSSTEAEYCGVALASCKLLWLRQLLCELGFSLPRLAIIWRDSIGVIYLSSNPVFHGRTKHVKVDVHFVCDLVRKGWLQVMYLSNTGQLADIFTKPLSSTRFSTLRNKLTIHADQSHLRGSVKEKQSILVALFRTELNNSLLSLSQQMI